LGSRVGLHRTLSHIVSPHVSAYPFATIRATPTTRCSMNARKNGCWSELNSYWKSVCF